MEEKREKLRDVKTGAEVPGEVKEKDLVKVKGTWECIVKRKRPDGKVEEERLGPKSNIITTPIRTLLAALCKNEGGFSGITYHAVGNGSASWDSSPVAPLESDVPLVAEIFRKAPTTIEFLDGGGAPTVTPTATIRVTTVFNYGDMAPGGVDLREVGIFGGTATGAADSGEMVNNLRHTKIFKDSSVEVTHIVKLEF